MKIRNLFFETKNKITIPLSIINYFNSDLKSEFFNVKKYYELIKDFLIDNSILPNEELFIFFKKLKGFSTNDKIYTENTNNFVFQYGK